MTEKPKLLSGGNPQIPKAEGDAPVQAYIAAMPGWKSAAGRRLDKLPPVGFKDPNTRYFHIEEDVDIDEQQLADWIRQAAKLPGWTM